MIYIALFLSVMTGILIGMRLPNEKGFAKKLLVLSAGFLLTLCVTEMFPIIYTQGDSNIGIWVIVGVLIQIVLEYFSKGIEHGHSHISKESGVPLSMVIGLLIHSFLEGMPIGDHHSDIYIQNLWIAVALHKLPIAILFAIAIKPLKIDIKVKYALFMLFAIATPLGMYIGEVIPKDAMIVIYAINAGIFLHISSLIIFESNQNHSFNLQKLGLLLLGVALGLLI